ncbi:hypothetical protein P40081_26295 [Paenibacillus sp. FSL P4-0081]|uniref:GNAT family N-acetyltransferase n=1 Tax=Paenibacillus sp. FSL P4-0081 TaxID=1536769 RepID=UPI0004F66E3F|nr:GNAT family N-acetyltransferase [Paenibacillus sp. FSL P4-0081]AIQ31282.1 hypothetical protein P40081_26295 [Paenibacillus sp. FSL P4-0081]
MDSAEHPQVLMIESSETTLLAGRADNDAFNQALTESLGFWEQVTPDNEEWRLKIPEVHPNKYIREYTRHRYIVTRETFTPIELSLPEGYVPEKIDLPELRKKSYKNADKIYKWAAEWGSDEHFAIAGCGCYIRHLDKIVSWSLSDCYNGGQVAIGIQTARSYRKMGLAKQVVSAVVQQCWDKGYGSVEWLCVSTNRGSRAVAERVGFMLADTYPSFTSYAPIENFADLNDDGWYEWGAYLQQASQKEPRLYLECLHCYVKANAVEKAQKIVQEMTKAEIECDLEELNGAIAYYRSEGLCSAFKAPEWTI